MQNLARRPSGIYVLRLAVPAVLRGCVGKREIILSTGTRDPALAKVIAGAAATQWRQRFLDLSRLIAISGFDSMDHREILKILAGSPVLLTGGQLPLVQAAKASGLTVDHLIRAAAAGKLALHVRVGPTPGHLVPEAALELVNPEAGPSGGRVAPNSAQMPSSAVEHVADGLLELLADDQRAAATALLTGNPAVDLVAFQAPGRAGYWFIPQSLVRVERDHFEVLTGEVEDLRRSVSSLVPPSVAAAAKEREKAALAAAAAGNKGSRADEPLSRALDHYVKNRLRHDMTSEGEITRVRNGCSLLIELQGDVRLADVTTDMLRGFRDQHLARVPARENKVRLIYKTNSVAESIRALEGVDWEVMSPSERDKRMRWISAWFRWLNEQKWIEEDPAAPLRGESVETKAERNRRKTHRADEARSTFAEDHLQKVFSATWFRTGRGELTRKNTYRTFQPFYYWGPLIAILTGGARVTEVSQLRLDDIGVTSDGTGFISFQKTSEDQKLKNASSRRRVPMHPLLQQLGLLEWVEALRQAGYDRLFPELKYDEEKGYGKQASKWFTRFMKSLGYTRDGTLTFHSLRHSFANALPTDTPDRLRKQFTGHTRGADVHDLVYRKDLSPEQARDYLQRLEVQLPKIAPFDLQAGLRAITDALNRKDKGPQTEGPTGDR